LFYQAWEKFHFQVPYERGERDRFSHYVLALLGLDTPGLQNRQDVADGSLLFYAGLLSMHSRSATGLRQVLWDYFDVPVEIEQFVGAWYPVELESQCSLGESGGYSEQLGFGANWGHLLWNSTWTSCPAMRDIASCAPSRASTRAASTMWKSS
jgi:type VI secretion system protein ImpH